MKKRAARCYEAEVGFAGETNQTVFYTLPDFGDGIRLYSCLRCGEIFLVDPERAHYTGKPVGVVIANMSCPACSARLAETLEPYPDSFVTVDGSVSSFVPKQEIPPESESVIKEFWDIYSELDKDA